MPTFVMLNEVSIEVYSLPQGSPDPDKTFNTDPWYAFAEILDGDESNIERLDTDPTSWYSPEKIINMDCSVIVDLRIKEFQPEWWAKMIEVRGEPKKSWWSGEMKFDPPDEGEPVEYPDLYPDFVAEET